MKRYGMVTGLHAGKVDEYIKLHEAVWPEVLDIITECNIHNYSIYHRQLDDGSHLLFSYFEYLGTNFETDMKRMADNPKTQEWWSLTAPCQAPVAEAELSGAWAGMQEVFHLD